MERWRTENNEQIQMKLSLKSENNKENSCEYHIGQNVSKMIDDINWVRSKVDFNNIKFTCRVCKYEKVYQIMGIDKEIKTLL